MLGSAVHPEKKVGMMWGLQSSRAGMAFWMGTPEVESRFSVLLVRLQTPEQKARNVDVEGIVEAVYTQVI